MLNTACPIFHSYASAADQTPGCSFDPTKVAFWGGELLCHTVDPAGTSICKPVTVPVVDTEVSPASLVATLAGWWLVWSLFKGGR